MQIQSLQDINSIKIQSPEQAAFDASQKIWDDIAKPLDGMGDFENVIAKISAIKNNPEFALNKKALLIMCADNGIVAEGVSQSTSEVTKAVVINMLKHKSSVAVMADRNQIDMFVYDVGMETNEQIEGLIDKKIKNGTNNFKIESAMSEDETIRAINIGIDAVFECCNKGYDIIATGEMGIGNTTTSSAVCSSIVGSLCVGRGAGLDDSKLANKKKIIEEAIDKYSLRNENAFNVLKTVGGFDIAALTGVCIGGALYGIPIVLDGVITLTAALIAEELVPGIREYLILSHLGKEPACEMIGKKLGLKPVIDANMALGEGSGAVMFMGLLDDAVCVYNNAARFSDITVDNYKRY